jgi:hypothetical protein
MLFKDSGIDRKVKALIGRMTLDEKIGIQKGIPPA